MDIFGILAMVGGLALFLYGMQVLGDGLKRTSGGRLEEILESLTSNKWKGALLGCVVTAVIQSSSATTVMVVGLVNSGIMKLTQAAGVILGANVGTTVTSWMLSLTGIESSNVFVQLLKPANFSPIVGIIGVIMLMTAKNDKKKDIGTILIGFAVLMFGMETMSSAVEPLAGNEKFTVTEGSAEFLGRDLLSMPIEDRARLGLFLGFQYPVEIPGVTMANFMKLAVNEQRKFRGEEPLSAAEFLKLMREKSAVVELSSKLTSRAVNEGFSGGEKKKNEIFQMAMLDPKLAILDETDSGLDIDALRIVATGVTKLHRADNATVVITHYQRLLDYIVPDVVHVLYKGRIIHSGDKSLALKLEKEGYDWLINEYDK